MQMPKVPLRCAVSASERPDADAPLELAVAEAAAEAEEELASVGSVGCPALRRILLMEDTEGMLLGSHTRCAVSWSRISQAKSAGFSVFRRRMRFTTDGVATCCNSEVHRMPIRYFESVPQTQRQK